MQSPIIDTKRRSSVMRMALCWGRAILGIAPVGVALSGLMLGDHVVHAEQKQASRGMTALSQARATRPGMYQERCSSSSGMRRPRQESSLSIWWRVPKKSECCL